MADRQPLTHEASDLSESSKARGIAHISPPTSPAISQPTGAISASDATVKRDPSSTTAEEDAGSGRGLGIAADPSIQTIKKASIQTEPAHVIGYSSKTPTFKSPDAFSPLGSAGLSYTGFPRDSSAENTPDLKRDRFSPGVGTFEEFQRTLPYDLTHAPTEEDDDYQAFLDSEDTQRLKETSSIRSAYEKGDFRPVDECPTTRDFYQSRFTWLNMTVLIICMFSCVFSAIFVYLAFREPFYGKSITSQGSFKPSDAILLTTVMAKAIEVSFATSFVAFLGQVLSRRAFMKEAGRGVTLSELSMWRWVVQPGTLITHWETARYAGFSLLGVLSLLSAILTMLYSSAATALVQPTLKEGNFDIRVMVGNVKTDFANVEHIKDMCATPIRTDKKSGGSTCLQIEHAGQGYHNYHRYLAHWNLAALHMNGSTVQKERPPGFGLFYENTTVTAQWMNTINTRDVSKGHGRVINNVSLAMPHTGIFASARDQRNGILQPEELNSEGTYSLRASVPSPVLNVLCANMNKDELTPIIYDEWNDEVVNITSYVYLSNNATTTNKTKVDDIFGWSDKDRLKYPPVFAKYPNPYNTIMNHTSYPWGRDAIYLLGQGGPSDDALDMTGTFVLCKIHMAITPECSTRYNVTGSGGTMEALCEDEKDQLAYIKMHPNAEWIRSVANWRDIGTDWANSLSLNTGIADADASNSRLLMQLLLRPTNPDPKNLDVDLDPALPSIGEALAVMSGCTLLKSTMDAPFVMVWNHTTPIIPDYEPQYFNASLRAQQYASGGVDSASKGWIVVLVLVFIMNVFVLIYFILHRGLVTDFSEPPNLFALAVNSPPSHTLAGACGGGPEGKQYQVNWFVNNEGDHLFMEAGEKTSLLGGIRRARPLPKKHHSVETMAPSEGSWVASVLGKAKKALGIKEEAAPPQKLRPVSAVESLRAPAIRPLSTVSSEYELEDGRTRTRRNYERLANRRSVL